MSESIPGFEWISFYGMVGPAPLPKAIVMGLNQSINEVLKQPQLVRAIEGNGNTIVHGGPELLQETLNNFVSRAKKQPVRS